MSEVQFYSAEPESKLSFRLFKRVASGYARGHYLGWRLFTNGIKTELNKSLLGVLWNFGEPAVLAVVFIILRKGQVISFGDTGPMNYSLYVIYGLLIYQAFFQSWMAPLGVFAESGQLLKQTKIFPESLIIQKLYQSAYESLFKIIILAIVSIWLGGITFMGFIAFVLVLAILQLFCLFLGFLLAPINTIYSDIFQFVSNLSRPLLFISPIFYDPSAIPQLELINEINPLAIFLSAAREMATGSFSGLGMGFFILCGMTLIMGIVGSIYFHVSVPIVSDKS